VSGSDRPRRVMRDGLSVTGYEDVSRPRKLNLCRSSRRPPTPYRRALRRRSSSAARSIPRRDRAAATFLEEVDDFPTAFDQARPHESLGQRMPLALHRGGHHLFRAPSVQGRRHGTPHAAAASRGRARDGARGRAVPHRVRSPRRAESHHPILWGHALVAQHGTDCARSRHPTAH